MKLYFGQKVFGPEESSQNCRKILFLTIFLALQNSYKKPYIKQYLLTFYEVLYVNSDRNNFIKSSPAVQQAPPEAGPDEGQREGQLGERAERTAERGERERRQRRQLRTGVHFYEFGREVFRQFFHKNFPIYGHIFIQLIQTKM
jgi:hypothetical protein